MLRDAVREAFADFYGGAMSDDDVDTLTNEIVRRVYPPPEGAGDVVSTTGRHVAICDRQDWLLWLPEHRAARPEWPWWEKPRLESMYVNLRPGDVLFDIGTEEGDQSALYATWLGSTGRIVLVEPNPMVWPNVKRIFEENDIPEPLACYVGFAGLHNRGDPMPSLGWPACADGPMIGDHGFKHLAEPGDTPSITIDLLTELVGAPTAITMDIEGAEMLALVGAHYTLQKWKPLVWVSIHPEMSRDLYGTTRGALLTMMENLGYYYEHLAAEHEHHVVFWHPEGRQAELPYRGLVQR